MNTAILTNTFPVKDTGQMKQKVLNWMQRFDTFCFLDNHHYPIQPHTEECLAGAGIRRKLTAPAGHALAALDDFIGGKKGWLFGHLGYDLKNETGSFANGQPAPVAFPDLFFFEPEIVFRLRGREIIIEADEPDEIYDELMRLPARGEAMPGKIPVLSNRISREEYLSIIRQLQKHILRGDCYEINFCQEFYAKQALIDPLAVYQSLTAISPNPFSALYRTGDQWLICASPERFLKKQGDKILSQPIKGTSKRVINNRGKDEKSRQQLFLSSKDRSENVMIVDLVRNDLSRICAEGTVNVEELYGVYSFPQVHQMISTISGTLKSDISFADIIRATFPMGSMTGAPKKRVIELIGQYEKVNRGIFSGALGYISPDADFDFNVVIRSIMYDSCSRYLSIMAGSGITFYSDPEKEWEECLLKAEAMKEALSL